MKGSTILWLLLLVIAAFYLGRNFERMGSLQTQVAELNNRVTELERVNIRGTERWGWAKRIASQIPLVGKVFHG